MIRKVWDNTSTMPRTACAENIATVAWFKSFGEIDISRRLRIVH
jgi:hypothetical protein